MQAALRKGQEFELNAGDYREIQKALGGGTGLLGASYKAEPLQDVFRAGPASRDWTGLPLLENQGAETALWRCAESPSASCLIRGSWEITQPALCSHLTMACGLSHLLCLVMSHSPRLLCKQIEYLSRSQGTWGHLGSRRRL